MVHDSFRQLATLPAEVLRQKTQVQFEGEVGIDSGGLIKEWKGYMREKNMAVKDDLNLLELLCKGSERLGWVSALTLPAPAPSSICYVLDSTVSRGLFSIT